MFLLIIQNEKFYGLESSRLIRGFDLDEARNTSKEILNE